MDNAQAMDPSGPFESRYKAFLETITNLRPSLHRYCSRMTGSVLDGEDVVQDALFEAYRKLDQYDDRRPVKPWLFQIAHNRCIDLLRRCGVRVEAEAAAMSPDSVEAADPAVLGVGRAVERLVTSLPPKERACVLLKDIFDYTLEEIAELVGSTVGGVKAALKRGRSKLAVAQEEAAQPRAKNPDVARVLHLYVERFNRRDWDGVRELIAADARLRVADAFSGPLSKSPYFSNYERFTVPWRLSVGEVDGEPVIIILQRDAANQFAPKAVVRLEVVNSNITRIADYSHCPWVLEPATSVIVGPSSPN
jgi:RNA polymerase sigma-70 factor (ECF subfamily)